MIFGKKKQNEVSDINPNERINYNEFDLLDELINRAFQSFALTLDTEDYVPASFINQVCTWIYKIEKKRYKKLKKQNKQYQKWFEVEFKRRVQEQRQARAQEQSEQSKALQSVNAENVPDDRGQRSER